LGSSCVGCGAVCPHHPLPVGEKVVCWRDAPSSPRDGVGSFALPSALGEEGVWGDWCSSSSTLYHPSSAQSPSTLSPSPPPTCDGKVGCWRDAPSSPRDGSDSSVMSSAPGEEGVWDDWCNSSSTLYHPSSAQSTSTLSPSPPLPATGRSAVGGTPPPLPAMALVRLCCPPRWERRGSGTIGAIRHRHPIAHQPPNGHRHTPLSQPDQQPPPASAAAERGGRRRRWGEGYANGWRGSDDPDAPPSEKS
jgi:hypothetical protein